MRYPTVNGLQVDLHHAKTSSHHHVELCVEGKIENEPATLSVIP